MITAFFHLQHVFVVEESNIPFAMAVPNETQKVRLSYMVNAGGNDADTNIILDRNYYYKDGALTQ